MDTRIFNFNFVIDLEPVGTNAPHVMIYLDREILFDDRIDRKISYANQKMLELGDHSLEIHLVDKPSSDLDQAIRIDQIKINGISNQKFIWQGVYFPDYPEPWATEQKALGISLAPALTQTDYLGWNGCWRLDFTSPVFTWIHRIENLGWIYD